MLPTRRGHSKAIFIPNVLSSRKTLVSLITSAHRFPGEFEAHSATWLLWPSRADNWRSRAYFAQSQVLALAAYIAHFEPVRLGAPASAISTVRRSLPPAVSVVEVEYNDTWVRDTGPITLVAVDKPSIAVDWIFNSWGGLFSDAAEDDALASRIADHERIVALKAPIVLEGGAVISDGNGTIITTEESVLASNRNPGLTRAEAEKIFYHFLNARQVIWLPFGLDHDEAGGHVDNVCAFASSRVLCIAATDNRHHPSHARLRDAKRILEKSTNASGQPFFLVDMPLPDPTEISKEEAAGFDAPEGRISRVSGTPLAPSYVNFYVTSGAVFLPTFNCSTDDEALQSASGAFPDRLIVPFPSREFLLGGGAIHCLTKEIPNQLVRKE